MFDDPPVGESKLEAEPVIPVALNQFLVNYFNDENYWVSRRSPGDSDDVHVARLLMTVKPQTEFSSELIDCVASAILKTENPLPLFAELIQVVDGLYVRGYPVFWLRSLLSENVRLGAGLLAKYAESGTDNDLAACLGCVVVAHKYSALRLRRYNEKEGKIVPNPLSDKTIVQSKEVYEHALELDSPCSEVVEKIIDRVRKGDNLASSPVCHFLFSKQLSQRAQACLLGRSDGPSLILPKLTVLYGQYQQARMQQHIAEHKDQKVSEKRASFFAELGFDLSGDNRQHYHLLQAACEPKQVNLVASKVLARQCSLAAFKDYLDFLHGSGALWKNQVYAADGPMLRLLSKTAVFAQMPEAAVILMKYAAYALAQHGPKPSGSPQVGFLTDEAVIFKNFQNLFNRIVSQIPITMYPALEEISKITPKLGEIFAPHKDALAKAKNAMSLPETNRVSFRKLLPSFGLFYAYKVMPEAIARPMTLPEAIALLLEKHPKYRCALGPYLLHYAAPPRSHTNEEKIKQLECFFADVCRLADEVDQLPEGIRAYWEDKLKQVIEGVEPALQDNETLANKVLALLDRVFKEAVPAAAGPKHLIAVKLLSRLLYLNQVPVAWMSNAKRSAVYIILKSALNEENLYQLAKGIIASRHQLSKLFIKEQGGQRLVFGSLYFWFQEEKRKKDSSKPFASAAQYAGLLGKKVASGKEAIAIITKNKFTSKAGSFRLGFMLARDLSESSVEDARHLRESLKEYFRLLLCLRDYGLMGGGVTELFTARESCVDSIDGRLVASSDMLFHFAKTKDLSVKKDLINFLKEACRLRLLKREHVSTMMKSCYVGAHFMHTTDGEAVVNNHCVFHSLFLSSLLGSDVGLRLVVAFLMLPVSSEHCRPLKNRKEQIFNFIKKMPDRLPILKEMVKPGSRKGIALFFQERTVMMWLTGQVVKLEDTPFVQEAKKIIKRDEAKAGRLSIT